MESRKSHASSWTALPNDFTQQLTEEIRVDLGELVDDLQVLVEGRIFTSECLMRIGVKREQDLAQYNFEASLDLASPPGANAKITPSAVGLIEKLEPVVAFLVESLRDFLTASQDEEGQVLAALMEAQVSEEEDSETENGEFENEDEFEELVEDDQDPGKAAAKSFDLTASLPPPKKALDLPLSWKFVSQGKSHFYFQHSRVNSALEAEADRLLGLADEALVHGLDLSHNPESEPRDEDALNHATALASEELELLRRSRSESLH